jgi:DNA polymerase-3 subunit epsilon
MRLLGIDFETTGLDTANDRIVEVGAVLWDVETKKPLKVFNEFLWNETIPPIPEEASRINGITDNMLHEMGKEPMLGLHEIELIIHKHRVDYLVAHNAENFDKAILLSELERNRVEGLNIKKTPWIDTRQDIPYDIEPTSKRLNHLAADCGFINPFQHRAVFDVLTMLRVLSQYDISKVLEYQKIPYVTVQAMVNYNDRQLAKEARYSWQNIGSKVYRNSWVKRIKKHLLEGERAKCKFPIVVLEEENK